MQEIQNDLFTVNPPEWYEGGELSSAHNESSYKPYALPTAFVLVCYPRDGTPVCTKELNGLQENLEKFQLPIIAASTDSPEAHNSFFSEADAFPDDIEYPVLSLKPYMLTPFAQQLILNKFGYCNRVVCVVVDGALVSVYQTPDDINPEMPALVRLVNNIAKLYDISFADSTSKLK